MVVDGREKLADVRWKLIEGKLIDATAVGVFHQHGERGFFLLSSVNYYLSLPYSLTAAAGVLHHSLVSTLFAGEEYLQRPKKNTVTADPCTCNGRSMYL